MNRRLVLRSPRYRLLQFLPPQANLNQDSLPGTKVRKGGGGREKAQAHQLIEHASIELHLAPPALPQLLVILVQALPMLPERLEAVLVDIVQPRIKKPSLISPPQLPRNPPLRSLLTPPLLHPRPAKHSTHPPTHTQQNPPQKKPTHTLAAHRVTFRPSRIHSSSPFPCASVLHTM